MFHSEFLFVSNKHLYDILVNLFRVEFVDESMSCEVKDFDIILPNFDGRDKSFIVMSGFYQYSHYYIQFGTIWNSGMVEVAGVEPAPPYSM